MLSNKWTFSLTSLVLMLALCFVAPSALAQFEIGLSVGDEDVSFADGNQVSMVQRLPFVLPLRR